MLTDCRTWKCGIMRDWPGYGGMLLVGSGELEKLGVRRVLRLDSGSGAFFGVSPLDSGNRRGLGGGAS
jgi:hypothetical protein